MKTTRFILLAVALNVCSVAYSQTIQVSGNIESDTTWLAETVEVTGDIEIKRNATLTIPAGTRVEFQGHYHVHIYGTILAEGAEGDSIIFTINNPTGWSNTGTTDGSWRGIVFNPGYYGWDDQDTSKFSYCRFEYTKYVPDIPSNWMGAAISVMYFYDVKITNSAFVNNYSKSKAGGRYEFRFRYYYTGQPV